MRRPLFLLLSLLTFAFTLTACGDTDGGTTADMPAGDMPAGDDGGHDGGHDESSDVADGARKIEVTGTSFEFDPGEITVTAGEDVAIVLTSEDLEHDFVVDELDTHVAAGMGETAEGGLRADEAGSYTYYCSVAGHREAGMEGTLTVEDA